MQKKIIETNPLALDRLGKSLFVSQFAKKIPNDLCNVLFIDPDFKQELQNRGIRKTEEYVIENFAYTLCDEKEKEFSLFADLQADPTDIALSGNLGSGRACYIGDNYNIKGIGRTSLAKADPNSQHGNGRLDIITALREAVMSRFIWKNFLNKTSRVVAVISIPYFTKYSWSNKPLQNALLVREDFGNLDRISHAAHSTLSRRVDITHLSKKCGIFDADLFFYQVLHGAWSIGNITLSGNWLDMESVSFVEDRGAYCNITKKYYSNIFGLEASGAIIALKKYAELTKQKLNTRDFFNEREKRLKDLFKEYLNIGISSKLLREFEYLSKICSVNKPINVFEQRNIFGAWIDFNKFFNRFDIYKNLLPKEIISKIVNPNFKALYKFKRIRKNYFLSHRLIKKPLQKRILTLINEFIKMDIKNNKPEIFKEKLNFLDMTNKIKKIYEKYKGGLMSSEELCEIISKEDFIFSTKDSKTIK